MNFNSFEYFVFLPICLAIYCTVVCKERLRDYFILIASYFFYMSWNWKYAILLFFPTVVDYWVARILSNEKNSFKKRTYLLISICMNIGLLAIFKYFNFFMDTVSTLNKIFGSNFYVFYHHLLLPVGISFYTFQTLSYTIDVYRGVIPAEKSFVKFAAFVSFFPQLIAGPIVRAATFLPQMHKTPMVVEDDVKQGVMLIFKGLFKKVIIADLLASLGVVQIFDNPGHYSSLDLLMALYGYSFQIYNDFSGYSDIATGSAKLFGFDLPINFNRPYLAQNIQEFWHRWHISLSTWLRDYLYIPLGGSRAKPWRVQFNLLLTMFLGGLWHGAALNFICWGLWHGVLLIIFHYIKNQKLPNFLNNILLQRFICFHLIVFSWLLFRISDLEKLMIFIKGLFKFSGGTTLHLGFYIVLMITIMSHFVNKKWADNLQQRLTKLPLSFQAALYVIMILVLISCSLDTPTFIYFQF